MPLDEQQAAIQLIASLRDEERQIVAGLVNGRSIASIAADLSIAPAEAEHAIQVLMEKLSAKTTADVVRIGLYASVSLPH